ncbi:GNAT family N-acetyltransferase [Agromyces sp. SYSU T00194]|uniref:GNAT family N-acetyltransferase n=1 Tax=Agromyces chitinivorans TaxID=3158560 RepID=UPI0033961D7B
MRIERVHVPERLGTADAAGFERYVALMRDVEAELWGHDDLTQDARTVLPRYRSEYVRRVPLLALDGDDALGAAVVEWEPGEDAETAILYGLVPSAERRRGIGSWLLAECERIALEAGRRVLISWSDHPAATLDVDGPRLGASVGDAVVPAADPRAAFFTRHGYKLGQVERMSVLDVGAGDVPEPEPAAGYRLVTWSGHAPDELVDAYAAAKTRMALDVPAADLTIDPEHWDADRVRTFEGQRAESGDGLLVAAAVAEDGAVAGYTELELPHDKSCAYQGDTLVVAAHRGRGLGLRVKQANHRALAETAPERTRVYTWNADENAHMLAINIALGFRTAAYSAAWQRRVDDGAPGL